MQDPQAKERAVLPSERGLAPASSMAVASESRLLAALAEASRDLSFGARLPSTAALVVEAIAGPPPTRLQAQFQRHVGRALSALALAAGGAAAAAGALSPLNAFNAFQQVGVTSSDPAAVSGVALGDAAPASHTLAVERLAARQENTGPLLPAAAPPTIPAGRYDLELRTRLGKRSLGLDVAEGDTNEAVLAKLAAALNQATPEVVVTLARPTSALVQLTIASAQTGAANSFALTEAATAAHSSSPSATHAPDGHEPAEAGVAGHSSPRPATHAADGHEPAEAGVAGHSSPQPATHAADGPEPAEAAAADHLFGKPGAGIPAAEGPRSIEGFRPDRSHPGVHSDSGPSRPLLDATGANRIVREAQDAICLLNGVPTVLPENTLSLDGGNVQLTLLAAAPGVARSITVGAKQQVVTDAVAELVRAASELAGAINDNARYLSGAFVDDFRSTMQALRPGLYRVGITLTPDTTMTLDLAIFEAAFASDQALVESIVSSRAGVAQSIGQFAADIMSGPLSRYGAPEFIPPMLPPTSHPTPPMLLASNSLSALLYAHLFAQGLFINSLF